MNKKLSVKLGDNNADNETVHKWVQSDSSKTFRTAFDKAFSQHSNLLEIYEKDKDAALALVEEQFEETHQHTA